MLTKADQAEIARKRAELEKTMDSELYGLYKTQQRVNRTCGSSNLQANGKGRALLGARDHGKKALPTSGSGDANHNRRRLHRVA